MKTRKLRPLCAEIRIKNQFSVQSKGDKDRNSYQVCDKEEKGGSFGNDEQTMTALAFLAQRLNGTLKEENFLFVVCEGKSHPPESRKFGNRMKYDLKS